MRTQEEAKNSQSTSASEDSEPKPVRKITDVVSDEARETRAKIEDEVGEVKEAIRLLTSAQSKLDLAASEDLLSIRADVAEVKESTRTGFDSLLNFWDEGRLRDLQRTVRETAAEIGSSRRALNDLGLAQTERHDDLMAGISRAALQVSDRVVTEMTRRMDNAFGEADRRFVDRQASLVEAAHQSEGRLKVWATDLASGVASDIVVQAQRSCETERAMFDALRARFDLVLYACAGSLLAHVALLAVWGHS